MLWKISWELHIIPAFIPAGIYVLKVNNRNTRTSCDFCSKLTIKTPEQRLEQVNAGWDIANLPYQKKTSKKISKPKYFSIGEYEINLRNVTIPLYRCS